MDPLIFIQKIFEFSDSKKEEYICVYNGNNLKWILPKNKKYAVPIIKNWRPYSIKNYIFWKFLKFLFFFSIPNILNNINIIKLSTSNLDWSNYGWKSKEKPIVSIYIGTRSNDQKIIIFLANKKSRSQKLIVKFPLESNAWELIKKEYLF